MKRFLRWLSNGLIFSGVAILVGTASLYGYSQYEQAQATRAAEAISPRLSPPTTLTAVSASPTPGIIPTVNSNATRSVVDEKPAFVPWSERGERPATSTPTPVPILPARRITADSIRLDAPVVESPIIGGEWQVPKFAAGHLEGTDQPLQGGNIVLAGHVESISSGNVFAHIDRLHPGDIVRLYTKTTVVSYKVTKIETVANNDMQVVAPTLKEVLTLITCSGEWLPLQHDYNERTVVIADRVS